MCKLESKLISIIFGIDAGWQGAVVGITPSLDLTFCADIDNNPEQAIHKINDYLKQIDCSQAVAIFEEPIFMPFECVRTVGKFGIAYGLIKAVFLTNEVVCHEVHPRHWKSAVLGAGQSRTERKSIVIATAESIFKDRLPDDFLSLKKYNHRADALMIAYYLIKQGVPNA